MNTGAFLCSCGGSCEIDLEGARDGVRDVDVVASSRLLCDDGRSAMERVVEEYDLDQLIVTACDASCRQTFEAFGEAHGLHPDAVISLNHRELACWVHDEAAATDKTARLVNATFAGLAEEAVSRTVEGEAGDRVAVVGDPEAAVALADVADVVLVADGRDYDGVDIDLDGVSVERGRVVAIDGRYGGFELALEARVTDDCISCMECVRAGPDGLVTRYPVDIDPDAPGGDWVDVCPTDAIVLEGVRRTIEVDQVVYPDGEDRTRGGLLGFHAGEFDSATAVEVERLLGGVEAFDPLDLTMDVCASGASSTMGCNACVEACPHGAVERPTVDSVSFDRVACQDCGACTSACPTGATRLREPSSERIAREVEALLATHADGDGGWLPLGRGGAGIETEVIAFLCSEYAEDTLRAYGRRAAGDGGLAYPPVLPVRVNCTDTIGEAHVMHALAAGADGVAVVGCGGRCLHSGPDPKADLVERLNRATGDLGLGERVDFLAPARADQATFVEELDAFFGGLDPSPVPSGEHEATGGVDGDRPNPPFDSHGWTLESVRAISAHVEPERDVVRGLKDFGVVHVDEACNLTPTCSNLCPADALRRTPRGDLQFNHERCVNCGLCEAGCPETAIEVDGGLDRRLLPENRDGEEPAWTTVYEGEMLECVRCGKPFTSAGSAAKVQEQVGHLVEGMAPPDADASVFEYCGDCRSKLIFDWGGE